MKTAERVRNMLSATHVIVHQGTMVPCVKMVSKITKVRPKLDYHSMCMGKLTATFYVCWEYHFHGVA